MSPPIISSPESCETPPRGQSRATDGAVLSTAEGDVVSQSPIEARSIRSFGDLKDGIAFWWERATSPELANKEAGMADAPSRPPLPPTKSSEHVIDVDSRRASTADDGESPRANGAYENPNLLDRWMDRMFGGPLGGI